MNREKLLQNPLPMDRTAARVMRAAKPEDVWRPMPKEAPHSTPIGAVLATAPIPTSAALSREEQLSIVGKRRDRMVVLGYAEEQGSQKKTRWVVRCDCGNFEHRIRIVRWLGTIAPDMCRECRTRTFKLRGYCNSRDPATRLTALQSKSIHQDIDRIKT